MASKKSVPKNIRRKNVRIDFDEDGLDDIAISGSGKESLFRMERLDGQSFWVCFYPDAKKDKRFYFLIKAPKGRKIRGEYHPRA